MPPNTMKFVQPAPAQEPVAWFDSAGDIRGRVSDEQLDALCRTAISSLSKRNGWCDATPSLSDYQRLQALVTSQGIRLMDYESGTPPAAPAQALAAQEPAVINEAAIQKWQGDNDIVMSIKAYKQLVNMVSCQPSPPPAPASCTTYAERFAHAVAILCGAQPPADMVTEWINNIEVNGEHRLQSWVLGQSATPAWAQGIVVLDAAHVLANDPAEGADHDSQA